MPVGPVPSDFFSLSLSFRHGDEGIGCWLAMMEGGTIFLGDQQYYVVPVEAVRERRGDVMLSSRPQEKAAACSGHCTLRRS